MIVDRSVEETQSQRRDISPPLLFSWREGRPPLLPSRTSRIRLGSKTGPNPEAFTIDVRGRGPPKGVGVLQRTCMKRLLWSLQSMSGQVCPKFPVSTQVWVRKVGAADERSGEESLVPTAEGRVGEVEAGTGQIPLDDPTKNSVGLLSSPTPGEGRLCSRSSSDLSAVRGG